MSNFILLYVDNLVFPTSEYSLIFLILKFHYKSWNKSPPNVLQLNSLFGITLSWCVLCSLCTVGEELGFVSQT